MEDLAGLTFTPSSAPNTQPKSAPPNQTRFPHNPPPTTYAPIPSRGTPNYNLNLSLNLPRPQQQSANAAAAPQRNVSAKTDSFASLSAFSGISRAGGATGSTTLEQQRLAREKERRERLERERKDVDLHFGAEEFWEKHSRQNTPTIITTDTEGSAHVRSNRSEVDLTAFSSDAPVSTASHFPPPSNDFRTTIEAANASVQDPFDMSGFGETLARTRYHTSPGYLETTNLTSADDILGILAQPVETFAKPKPASPKPGSPSPKPSPKPVSRPSTAESSDEEEDTERDRAIASIVEMGFTIGQATKALSQTSSGIDVQQALNTLLSRPSSSASQGRPTSSSSARLERPPPGRLRTPDPLTRTREQYSQQKDISQIAGEVGSSLLKGAGSLWKSGREKVSTLMQEYNGEMEEPGVPKWMREQQRHVPARRTQNVATDEARALETRDGKTSVRRNGVHRSEGMEREGSRPGSGFGIPNDRIALRKQVEEEAEMGYRSSSRRRPPNRINTPSQDPPSRTTTPSTKPPEPSIDLFSSTTEDIPKPISQRPSRTNTPHLRPIPTSPQPPKPQRVVPPTSNSALSSSHISRQKGSEAFKVGDYPLALTHYTSALTALPSSHPQRIIILSNRSFTHIKLGDAKAAILDCDDLIREVGPGRGDGEMVSDMDGVKNLREIWGKGVIRRAMALEMLEKYSEALEMWKVAVDAGIGGSPSLEGKRRCESAAGIKPKSQATSMSRTSSTPVSRGNTPVPRAQSRSSTPIVRPKVTRPAGPSASENLAQYNKSVAADEDEKTRLYDTVDARITSWKTGKEANIRALLSSLDGVLWAEAGWKKVSMAELVVVSKVKIVYMKAIAKLHPDKIPTNATVEQKMIAAAVFAIINDAYNIFKEQNGL